AFAGLTIVAHYEPRDSYILSLAFSFLFWFFLFHAIVGFKDFLTPSWARAIDYVYLGVAAVGVFVLAFNYEGRRQDYDASEQTEKLTDVFSKYTLEVGRYLLRLDFAVCGRNMEKPFPVHCDLIDTVDFGAATERNKEDPSKITVEEFLEALPP